ncbi:Chromodomain Y-like protein [Cucumispora dikerogammari]|nr:Chromodomain Y-like protein [Cucumispora dikerogammari]
MTIDETLSTDEDSEISYEFEEILADRYNKLLKTYEYLIKWKDYDESYNSWEPKKHLNPTSINEYNKHKQLKKQEKQINSNLYKLPSSPMPNKKRNSQYIVFDKTGENNTEKFSPQNVVYREGESETISEFNRIFTESIKLKESQAFSETHTVTNNLSKDIEKIIGIVFDKEPVYNDIYVIVQISGKVTNVPIKQAEIEFPELIIDYLEKRSVF